MNFWKAASTSLGFCVGPALVVVLIMVLYSLVPAFVTYTMGIVAHELHERTDGDVNITVGDTTYEVGE